MRIFAIGNESVRVFCHYAVQERGNRADSRGPR